MLSGFRLFGNRAKTLSSSASLFNQVAFRNARMFSSMDLKTYDITNPTTIHRNLSPAKLYERAIATDGAQIASSGAIVAYSGAATGRIPGAKRLVDEPGSTEHVFWESNACIPLSEESFEVDKETAVDFLNSQDELFVVDGYGSWDPRCMMKVRVITSRPYHALFMHNMLIRPDPDELGEHGDFEPDVVIYNAGVQKANSRIPGHTMKASVNFHLSKKPVEQIILGSEYAGEMKKGLFTIMHYLMPLKGYLSMHCSANCSMDANDPNPAIFFGLSGTGKTTLSADEDRLLIGDDEHVWTDTGIFNIEGGCYAKAIDLTAEKEPLVYNAIKYGSILENVVMNEKREVDYEDVSITQNTRVSYPIEHIPNAKIPCITTHPKNIVLLTCDAFGVLPPVSKLTKGQAMYHFINGYTAKVAGTEVGVTEPSVTFSACFGEAFLVHHPSVYAKILAEKIEEHDADCWLVNTGWVGGGHGVGDRMSISGTRAIITAIHDGTLGNMADSDYHTTDVFKLRVPNSLPGVDTEILDPATCWEDSDAFQTDLRKLGGLYQKNHSKYETGSAAEINEAGPQF